MLVSASVLIRLVTLLMFVASLASATAADRLVHVCRFTGHVQVNCGCESHRSPPATEQIGPRGCCDLRRIGEALPPASPGVLTAIAPPTLAAVVPVSAMLPPARLHVAAASGRARAPPARHVSRFIEQCALLI